MKSIVALCALVMTTSFAQATFAQTSMPEPTPETAPTQADPAHGAIKKEGACMKDMDLLCPGVDHHEMKKCMHDNRKKVSKECRANMDKMKKAMKGMHEACHEDVEKYCAEEKPGRGAVMKCMKDHKDELSQACKDKIENMKAKRKHK